MFDKILKYNLEQGKILKKYNQSLDDMIQPNLSLIEEGHKIESFEINSLPSNDIESMEGLESLQNNFNQLLAEYNQVYKLFSEDLLNKNMSKKKIINYLGKVISDNEGFYYYVNNFGYTHKYTPNAWDDNNESCPHNSISYKGDINDFKKGHSMVKGQPCNVAGKNIQNISTGEIAWVDIKGTKHIFTSNANLPSSCRNKAIKLSSDDYNLIPNGSPMTNTDECISLDVNPIIWKNMQDLEKQIKKESVKLNKQMKQMKIENNDMQQLLNSKRQTLYKNIDTISKSKKDVLQHNNMLVEISGEEDDATLRMKSNYYSYILWILIMVIIIVTTFSYSIKSNENISGIVYVILALFILMILVSLYNYFF